MGGRIIIMNDLPKKAEKQIVERITTILNYVPDKTTKRKIINHIKKINKDYFKKKTINDYI